MQNEKTFKTKTGYCNILPDKIILTRDGLIGNIASVTVGSNISRVLILYGIIGIGLFYYAYDAYQHENNVAVVLWVAIGIYLLYGILNNLNHSATSVIERNTIKGVNLKQGIKGLTRSRFEVKFEDKKGKTKKRLIMMPGVMANGQNETEKAIRILREEKLLLP